MAVSTLGVLQHEAALLDAMQVNAKVMLPLKMRKAVCGSSSNQCSPLRRA